MNKVQILYFYGFVGILLFLLVEIENITVLESAMILFGGRESFGIFQRISFILSFVIYYTLFMDRLGSFLKIREYVVHRCNKKTYFLMVLKKNIYFNLEFVLFIAGIFVLVSMKSHVDQFWISICYLIKLFLQNMILSTLQIIFLIKGKDEINILLIIFLLVLWIFFDKKNVSLLHIGLFTDNKKIMSFNIIYCIFLIVLNISLINKEIKYMEVTNL